ncbi:MAG: hypothetical protein J0I45_16535 [Bosea sp.]|nr:hypothetical protein [Bosea sp. (in: a-proteobacteria)]
MKRIVHLFRLYGGGEHAFCGLAFDAYDSGDAETDDDFREGRPGLRITCPECCRAIRSDRDDTKGVRLAPAEGDA